MPQTLEPVGQLAIAARIAELKTKYDRLPRHWEARRIEAMKEIDRLVDKWLTSE